MNNAERAHIYDECLRESDLLQRQNSKIKSDFAGNIPPHMQQKIHENEQQIAYLVKRLENLFI